MKRFRSRASCSAVSVATPVRARKAEENLIGKDISAELADEAGKIASQECQPTSDLRGSEQYKRAIVGTLVKRAAVKAYERAMGTGKLKIDN